MSSKFVKRKYRGKYVKGKWVFGGIEKLTDKCFACVVANRNKETLLEIIKKMPVTLIITDFWKSYDCLVDEGFQHLKVNHSLNFVASEIGSHTNSIEGTWSAYKRPLQGIKSLGQFNSYLAEYVWRSVENSKVFA